MCWNPQNRPWLSKMIDLRGHMPRFTLKMNMFFHLSPWKHHNCVFKISKQGLVFWRWFDFRGNMPRFTLKYECFPIYLLGNPINMCWNPQNRPWLSKRINLRSHMLRFTLKMKIIPSISLEAPSICVETLRTGLDFPRTINLRGHMPRFTLKLSMFFHLSHSKPHKCVLRPSEQGSIFWDNRFEEWHA